MIQATAKCKKLCHMRAVENAFSKVLLVVLGNGKVTVEIDTTRPELRNDVVPENQLIKVCVKYNFLCQDLKAST